MRVRARVNQSDISRVATGLPATIRLDAYPELTFDGRVELVAPLAVASSLTGRVRSFGVVVSIRGNHPLLLPDLTASVDIAKSGNR
jgi:HlyD family secretion protein